MPPGIYAPSTPAASLKAQRPMLRTQSAVGGAAPAGGFGSPSSLTYGAGGSGTPPQPPGGGHYVAPAGQNVLGGMTYDSNTGMVGSAGIGITPQVDLDQQRRDRDKQDYADRLAIDSRYDGPPAGGGGRAPGPGPGSTPTPPIGEIPWNEFEPKQVQREPGLTTMPREVGKGPEDRTAADSAIFSRAAERIGRIGAGNLRSLKSQMTNRGISGTGIQAQGITAAKNNTAGQLGDVVRDQAIEGLRREQDVDDRDLSAGIAQRGQDLGIASTNYSGGISQRGQDLQQADWKLQALPSILALMRARQGA